MDLTYDRHLDQTPASVLRAVDQAAELWGAGWRADASGGELHLPATQGLRQGVLCGHLRIEPSEMGASLHLEIDAAHLAINRSAAGVLLLGGLGGLTLVFWPLSPKVLQLAPVGAVLAIVAWLLVVSRLRYTDPDDFLDLVAELAEGS